MKKLLDLRFVIGVFFAIVGILLSLYYITGSHVPADEGSVNIWCGVLFVIFGAGMILLSYVSKIDED